jgi:hypothetical protein
MTMSIDALLHAANAFACGAIAYFVGFPRVPPGRHLTLRATIARTLVASMAAGVCVSILLHYYAPQFEVVLNFAIAYLAYVRNGDIAASNHTRTT